MASEMYVDTIAASDGTSPATLTKQSAAKAFHAYGDQSAGALNASSETLNISSYEDTGTGRSRLNMTSAMAVAQTYMVNGSTQSYDYGHYAVSSTKYESGNVNSSASYADGVTHAVIHGDLA